MSDRLTELESSVEQVARSIANPGIVPSFHYRTPTDTVRGGRPLRAVIDFLKGAFFLWDTFLCGSPEPRLVDPNG